MLYVETDSDRALREIINRYQPKIMRYFLRNSATRSRAEDLTQEVLIRIVRNRASFDPNLRFSTWSKTIGERIAMNAARSVVRSRVTSFADLAANAAVESPYLFDPTDPEPPRAERATRSATCAPVSTRWGWPRHEHRREGLRPGVQTLR